MVLAVMSMSAFAQEQGKIRGSLNTGYAIPTESGGGICLDGQLGYNLYENMNVGLKVGYAIMLTGNGEGDISVPINESYLGTYTYLFNLGGSAVTLFGGAGLGLYRVAGVTTNVLSLGGLNPDVGEKQSKFGGMLTAGIELGTFRVGVEYNLIPNTKTESAPGVPGVSIKNNYMGLTIGYTFGGGSWGNK